MTDAPPPATIVQIRPLALSIVSFIDAPLLASRSAMYASWMCRTFLNSPFIEMQRQRWFRAERKRNVLLQTKYFLAKIKQFKRLRMTTVPRGRLHVQKAEGIRCHPTAACRCTPRTGRSWRPSPGCTPYHLWRLMREKQILLFMNERPDNANSEWTAFWKRWTK